jgi:cobalamin biosynthesis Mg chelatase CobN
VYAAFVCCICAELEQLMQQVHLMVWPQAGEAAAAAAAAATAAQVAAAAAPTPADLQQLPVPSFSSNSSSGTDTCMGGTSSGGLMAAAAGSSSSGSGSDTGSLARQKSLSTLLVDLEASEQLLQLLKDVDQRVQMLMTIE